MFQRRRAQPPAFDPLVTDRHGRVVGVRTAPPASPREDKAARAWRRRAYLAETGELLRQAELRNQAAAFHVDNAPAARWVRR
jgi:hypothetical protein